MTILEAIETEVSNLSRPCKFYFSSMATFNANVLDNIPMGEYPIALVLPFNISEINRDYGRIINDAEIEILFLDKVHQSTLDEDDYDIDEMIVLPMRRLSTEFINRLDLNDIIEEDGVTSVVHRTTAGQAIGDAHVHGDYTVLTVKFSEDTTTCVDD